MSGKLLLRSLRQLCRTKPNAFSTFQAPPSFGAVASPRCIVSVNTYRAISSFQPLILDNRRTSPSNITVKAFSTESGNSENKPSLYQRFKLMYKEYWYVLVPVHLATSAVWFGGFYYMAISGVDIVHLLEAIGTPESWVTMMRESKAGGIVTAYTLYKIATPARYTVTLGGTTVSISYLKKWGLIKPMPSKAELQNMYQEKKTALKEKMNVTKDEIKDEFSKTKDDIINLSQHMKEAQAGLKNSMAETKVEFKQGVHEAAEEWKHIGRLVKRNSTEYIQQQKNKT